MYAVIRTGGKQYRVSENDILNIERLKVDAGAEVEFDVLAVGEGESLKVGTPIVEGAQVKGTVLVQGRDRKVIIFKFKRRKKYRRKKGHRQYFTRVQITDISA